MDKIIIINDNRIEEKLEKFIVANQKHIRLISDMDELALGRNPVLKEIIDRYEEKHKIRIIAGNQVWMFRSSEIIRFETKGIATVIYLVNGQKHQVNLEIDEISKQLESFSFVRVHSFHIVNVNAFSKIYEMNSNAIELTDGAQIPVSKEYKASVLRLLQKLNI